MVVDSILQFMSQMDETVLALMDDYDDFYMIMKNNRGIHPIDLQKSIKRLYRSNKIRKSKYIRIMASASNTNIHGFEDIRMYFQFLIFWIMTGDLAVRDLSIWLMPLKKS